MRFAGCQQIERLRRAQRTALWPLTPVVLGACLWAAPLSAQPVDVPATDQTPAASAGQPPADPNPGAFTLSGGGAEFQKLGDTTKFFNGGDSSQVIGSVGIGFSY